MLIKHVLICILLSASLIGCKKSGDIPEPPSPPLHSLEIKGEVQLLSEVSWYSSANELRTRIWAVNLSPETSIIKTGRCAFNILAYSQKENSKELVWHNRMPENYICADEQITYTIPPNDTLLFEDQAYISGKSWYWNIPKGEWKFVLEAKTENDQSFKIDANTVVID